MPTMTESARSDFPDPPLLSPVPLPQERPVIYRAAHQPPETTAGRRGSNGSSQQFSSEATSTAQASPRDTATTSPAGVQLPTTSSLPGHQPSDSMVSNRCSPMDAMQRVMKQYPHGSIRQVNCLFLGRQGNGKSSLINSIYQTVTDSNDNLCEVGYGDQSKTLKYACCAELDFKRLMPLILFDTKGLSDSNDKGYRELIVSILKGRFKPNHNMNKPRWVDYSCLPSSRMLIDVVVFVYAYGTPFPHRLAEAVATAARSCDVAVIPVITHYDQVVDKASLRQDEERCKAAFQTSCVLTLANLNALRANPFTMTLEKLALRERQVDFAKMTVVDLISQILLSGQKHQQDKKLNSKKPIAKDKCRLM